MSPIRLSEVGEREPVAGFKARFVHSESMTLAFWEIDAGAELPEHSHPHEQIAHGLEGELELVVGGESHLLGPGTVVVIPSDVPHAARARTHCRVLDVFHPVREDYR